MDLDEGLAGLPHHEIWARMFDVDFLERTIRSRFGGRPPLGLIRTLEEALSEYLNVGVDHVRRVRTGIRQCRKGLRDRVKWLRA